MKNLVLLSISCLLLFSFSLLAQQKEERKNDSSWANDWKEMREQKTLDELIGILLEDHEFFEGLNSNKKKGLSKKPLPLKAFEKTYVSIKNEGDQTFEVTSCQSQVFFIVWREYKMGFIDPSADSWFSSLCDSKRQSNDDCCEEIEGMSLRFENEKYFDLAVNKKLNQGYADRISLYENLSQLTSREKRQTEKLNFIDDFFSPLFLEIELLAEDLKIRDEANASKKQQKEKYFEGLKRSSDAALGKNEFKILSKKIHSEDTFSGMDNEDLAVHYQSDTVIIHQRVWVARNNPNDLDILYDESLRKMFIQLTKSEEEESSVECDWCGVDYYPVIFELTLIRSDFGNYVRFINDREIK